MMKNSLIDNIEDCFKELAPSYDKMLQPQEEQEEDLCVICKLNFDTEIEQNVPVQNSYRKRKNKKIQKVQKIIEQQEVKRFKCD